MLAILMLNRMGMKRIIQTDKKVSKISLKLPDDNCCRTCLGTENLAAIFYKKEIEQKRSEELLLVTGLEIKVNDGLSQKICINCLEIINATLQFRKRSRKAEKALLNKLIKTKPKKKRTVKNTKLPETQKSDDSNEQDYCFDYDILVGDDDFQNDHDNYDYMTTNDGAQPDIEQPDIEQLPLDTEKIKRTMIPNASSYKCHTCNKEFKIKSTYRAHLRFHTSYAMCESCGKRCRNNNQLQEHKRARHGLGKIHKCAYCEYSSATKEALIIHERRHTGERPYVCDHCGASFHRRSNLVQHIAIHLPEKNFQCDMCPKRLKSRKFLQIHKHNAHTGKKYGYLCPVCEHRFEKPNKVRAHIRRVHGIPDEQQAPIMRVQL